MTSSGLVDRDRALISKEFGADPLELPSETALTLAAYQSAKVDVTAYIELTSVGGTLPDRPLFMTRLAATYDATWEACPDAVRELVT